MGAGGAAVRSPSTKQVEEARRVGQVRQGDVRPRGGQRFGVENPGGNGGCAGASGAGTRHIMRGVADHPDVGGGEGGPGELGGASECERHEGVAVVVVVGKCAESEPIVQAVVGELEAGAAFEVSGEEAEHAVGPGLERVKKVKDAGQEASRVEWEQLREGLEVSIQEPADVGSGGRESADGF